MWTRTADGANKKLVLHMRLRFGSLSITTQVSFLANEFDVRSVLHSHVSLAAFNQIHVIHEAMNGCKKSKDSLKACFENVSITKWTTDLQSIQWRNFVINMGASCEWKTVWILISWLWQKPADLDPRCFQMYAHSKLIQSYTVCK